VSRLSMILSAVAALAFAGCAIGNNARVSLGASANVGYNAGSLSTPQESGMTNAVHRVGGGTVSPKTEIPAGGR